MKFKVGDKIKCKKTYDVGGVVVFQRGKEYTVRGINSDLVNAYTIETDLVSSTWVYEKMLKEHFIVDDPMSNYDYAMGIV